MNIVDLVKDQLTSQVLGNLGSLVGSNEAQTKAATAAAVPALLSGLSKLASSQQGAGQIASALGGLDLGALGNLAGLLGGSNASKVSDKGGSLLGSLFGNSITSTVVETLASFLGIKGGIARSLLSYLAPVVLGTVAKQLTGGGKSFDASSVQSLFADQGRNIQSALPAGLSLGDFGGLGKAVASAASAATSGGHGHVQRREPESSGFPSWLPWLALPLIALGAYFVMNRDNKKPVDKAATVKAPDTRDMMEKMKKTAQVEGAKAAAVVEKAGEDVANTAAAVVEKAGDALGLPEMGDALKLGGDLTGLFGKLTETFTGVTDAASAEAAIPSLKDFGITLDALKGSTEKLPEAGKASIKDLIGKNLGSLTSLIDTVLAIPGVGDILRPIVEPMVKTTGALGL